MKTYTTFSPVALAALICLVPSGNATAQPVTGAVFTTDGTGKLVNGNIYDAKQDVHLNGGPLPSAPCGAAGLPDGDYYFQVTDPSGKTLLSTDSINERKVRVSGGLITAYLGTSHQTGTGKCPNSISVALLPYDNTPNPGREYKAWMTPTQDYAPGAGNFGFVPRKSKTDNFKIKKKGKVKLAVECLRDIEICNDDGRCDATVAYPQPTIVGGTAPYQTTYNPAAGTPLPVGFTVVTITVTDAKGNADTCNFSVTVIDCEPPVITCGDDISVGNDPGECLSTLDPGKATVIDNCDGALNPAGARSDGLDVLAPYPVGTTTITWSAADSAGNKSSCTQTVTVRDTEKPTIVCPPDIL